MKHKKRLVAGTVYLKVGRRIIPLRGHFRAMPSRVKRTTSGRRKSGYTELPRVPYIEGDVLSIGKKLPKNLDRVTDATLFAKLVDGRVIIMQHCDTIRTTLKKKRLRMRFEAMTCEDLSI